MTHPNEEQLVLHYYGEAEAAGVADHLAACESCRDEYRSLQLVLNAVDGTTVPERSPEYGREVWRRIEGKVGRRGRWPLGKIWIWAPAVAALLAVAFLAGRFWPRPGANPGSAANTAATATPVRERVLLVAVGDHLERSQMILAEIENAPDAKARLDLAGQRNTAQDLLQDNRLYRQTALRNGDTAMASVLDDLERVLAEIAHAPSDVSARDLEALRHRIESQGLLFKVRVIGAKVREKERGTSL